MHLWYRGETDSECLCNFQGQIASYMAMLEFGHRLAGPLKDGVSGMGVREWPRGRTLALLCPFMALNVYPRRSEMSSE